MKPKCTSLINSTWPADVMHSANPFRRPGPSRSRYNHLLPRHTGHACRIEDGVSSAVSSGCATMLLLPGLKSLS